MHLNSVMNLANTMSVHDPLCTSQPKRAKLSNSGGFLSHDIYGLKLQLMIHIFYSQYILRTNLSHFVKQIEYSVCDRYLKTYYEFTK